MNKTSSSSGRTTRTSSDASPAVVVGDIVRFTVPGSGTVVPAIVVEIGAEGVASLQVFRITGDGSFLIRNISYNVSGSDGTYRK